MIPLLFKRVENLLFFRSEKKLVSISFFSGHHVIGKLAYVVVTKSSMLFENSAEYILKYKIQHFRKDFPSIEKWS